MMLRPNDYKWINGIGVYFFMLDGINIKLKKLIRNKFDTIEEVELLFFDIAVDLNRLIPMKYKKISYDDGILKFSNSLEFIKNDYNVLYKNHRQELIEINDLRNKFEHVPHVIKWTNYVGSNMSKNITFINDEYNFDIIEGNIDTIKKREKNNEKLKWKISTDGFVEIVIFLNEVFMKIQEKIKNYFNNNDALEHPYIQKLIRIDFNEYIRQLQNL